VICNGVEAEFKHRYAIDGTADFTSAEPQIQALATADPNLKSRLSTTISLKTAAPDVGKGAPKGAEKGEKGKEKRKDSGSHGKDGGKKVKRKV